MLINIVLSVNLCYYWLKRKQFNIWLCLTGAVITIFFFAFQSHRQIMFVGLYGNVDFSVNSS